MIRYLWPLTVILCAIVGLIGTALGGHIYRWEVITWQVIIIMMATLVIGWQWLAEQWQDLAALWEKTADLWKESSKL